MVLRYGHTTKKKYLLEKIPFPFLLVYQINARHHFLTRFVGPKEREKLSFSKANNDNIWITVTTFLCCILEIVLYFVYNRMVILI